MLTAPETQTRLPSASDRHPTDAHGTSGHRVVAHEESHTIPNGDRALAFTQLVHDRLDEALVRCEERYPQTASHSVLVVVVERDPAQWRGTLDSIYSQIFGPSNADPLLPARLEVIDRATDDAIQRLMAAGLLGKTTRTSRPLFPAEETAAPLLSDAKREQAAAHRAAAAHKLKLARILGDAGFADEARPALLDAVYSFGCAFAVENWVPEPLAVYDTVIPPLAHHWKDALPLIAGFVRGAGDWKPVAAQLAKV